MTILTKNGNIYSAENIKVDIHEQSIVFEDDNSSQTVVKLEDIEVITTK